MSPLPRIASCLAEWTRWSHRCGPGGYLLWTHLHPWRPLVLQILLDSAVAHLGPAPTRLVLRKYWTCLATLLVPLRLMRSSSRSGYSSSFLLVLSRLIGAPGADATEETLADSNMVGGERGAANANDTNKQLCNHTDQSLYGPPDFLLAHREERPEDRAEGTF